MSYELWTESRSVTGLRLGEPRCETNPCDEHQSGSCGDLVIEYRDVLSPGAWLADDGEWVLLSCCSSGSSADQDCCPDNDIPTTIQVTIVQPGSTVILTATFNGSYWEEPTTGYALRCNSGTWEVGRVEGGVLVWYTADGRCEPDFFQGYSFEDTSTSVSFTAGYEDSGSPPCDVWGYVQTLYVPDCVTIGDPVCAESFDCFCEDDNPVDRPCSDDCPELPRFIWMDVEVVPNATLTGCAADQPLTALNGRYLLESAYDAIAGEWEWSSYRYIPRPDADNGVALATFWRCNHACWSGSGDVPILGLTDGSAAAWRCGETIDGVTLVCDPDFSLTFTLLEQVCDPFYMRVMISSGAYDFYFTLSKAS